MGEKYELRKYNEREYGIYDTEEEKFIQRGSLKVMQGALQDLRNHKDSNEQFKNIINGFAASLKNENKQLKTETTDRQLEKQKEDLRNRERQALKDAGDEDWENLIGIKNRLPEEQYKEFEKESDKLSAIDMIHSILTYTSPMNWREQYILEDKYMQKYIKTLGEDVVKELANQEIEEYKKATINKDVYTDGEGVSYNSVTFKDESKEIKVESNGTDIAADAIMSYSSDNGKTLDTEWLNNSIQLYIDNERALYDATKESRRPAHSIAYDALIIAINDKTESTLTSRQIQAGFKKLGLDFKEIIKPSVEYVEERRKELKEESVEDYDTDKLFKDIIDNVPEDVKHLGNNCYEYKNLFIELRPDTIFTDNTPPEMDFAIFETEEDMNTDYESNIGTDYVPMTPYYRYWEAVKLHCDKLTESKEVKTESTLEYEIYSYNFNEDRNIIEGAGQLDGIEFTFEYNLDDGYIDFYNLTTGETLDIDNEELRHEIQELNESKELKTEETKKPNESYVVGSTLDFNWNLTYHLLGILDNEEDANLLADILSKKFVNGTGEDGGYIEIFVVNNKYIYDNVYSKRITLTDDKTYMLDSKNKELEEDCTQTSNVDAGKVTTFGEKDKKEELYDPMEGKAPDLTSDIVEFMWDFDTYNFNDNYEDRDEAFEEVIQQITTEDGRLSLIATLKEISEEDNEETIKESVKKLITRIEEFGKELEQFDESKEVKEELFDAPQEVIDDSKEKGLYSEAKEEFDEEFLKYLLRETEINRHGEITYLPDFEDAEEYKDLTEEEYNKSINYLKKLIENAKFYDNDGKLYIQLSDNHTFWEIDDNVDLSRIDIDDFLRPYFDTFEEDTGVELWQAGRSGRHIVVELTLDNLERYDELKAEQELLERQFIEEINNTSKEEESKKVKTESVEYITQKELDEIDDDYKTTVGETIKTAAARGEDEEEVRKMYKDLGYEESDPMILGQGEKGTTLKPFKLKTEDIGEEDLGDNTDLENIHHNEDETEKTIVDYLEDLIGQHISAGELNSRLQGTFSKYNTLFITPSELYDLDWDEPQEIYISDDDDEYTITYDIIDAEEGIIEVTDINVQ